MVEEEERREEKEEKKGLGALAPLLTKAILGIIVLIVIIGISYKVATYVKERRNKTFQEIESIGSEEKKKPPLEYEELGEFTGPLAEEGHFYKATIRLWFDGKKFRHLAAELTERKWEIRDLIDTIMRGKTSVIQTKDGKEALKEELRERINELLIDGKIEKVLIDELVVQ
jgi:flagellar FliL protein